MTTKENIIVSLKQVIKETLPHLEAEKISTAGRLADLGANSIDRAEIAIRTMESLGLKIPLIEFAKVTNIDGLIDLFSRYANGR